MSRTRRRSPPPGRRLAACSRGLLVAGTVGASGTALRPGAPFDGRHAYELTKLQLSFGPRPAGVVGTVVVWVSVVVRTVVVVTTREPPPEVALLIVIVSIATMNATGKPKYIVRSTLEGCKSAE